MPRIVSQPGDDAPRIDRESVFDFFEQRAVKAPALGPTRAVIYQDKHPDLAERRDQAEKQLLFPKIGLSGDERVLDVGCGSGRWTGTIAPHCALYHGVDLSPGLVRIAKEQFDGSHNVKFSVCPVDEMSLERIGEDSAFTRIVSFGVFIYLNDDEALKGLNAIVQMADGAARLILREPLAVQNRLTIKEHFSEDMDQTYNAIYRTEAEFLAMVAATIGNRFRLLDSGDVYGDPGLNNRADTRQRWFAFGR